MARKKVKLAYIVQNSKRNTVFRKRKNGLIKKVNEISILCGVEACAIIYNQDDPQPEVWPSESGTQHVVNRFQTTSQLVQSKNKLDHESYLNQRIQKAQELLMKQQNDNKKKKMENMIDHFMLTGQIVDNTDMTDPNDLLSFIDENLKRIEHRMESMQSEEEVQNIGAHTMNIGEHTMNVVGEQTNMGDIQGVMIEGDHMNMNNVQGMLNGEEQVNMGHTQGLVISGGELETNMGMDTNMDDMQVDQGWSTNFTNNIDGLLPFGDADVPNAFWPNPHFP